MDTDPPSESNDSSLIKRFLHFLRINRSPDTTEDLEQEIQELLEEGEESGLISAQEGELISSIFEFRDTLAHEIMTPRTEIVCLPETATAKEIVNLIIDKGFSRIPIYSDSPDKVIGIVHAKDLLSHAADSEQITAGEVAKPPFFVSESQKIVDLLKDFQTQKNHMAIVTDEFGGVRGLVTLEDVIEEIVGEIADEYDKQDIRWKVMDGETLLTDAKVDLEEIEEFFHTELPEGPYESVGGLLIHQLGRVPEKGAIVEIDSLTFQVISATNRRIITVKIQKK